MFIPIHDANPLHHIKLQWVTLSIIALNVIVYLFNIPFNPADGSAGSLSIGFGHVPSVSHDIRTLPEEFSYIPENFYFVTALTYAFIHNDLMHLGGNMLFLWVFGDNVEDAMGHFKFLIFYVASAVFAAWFHALIFPDSDSPLIGASGAAAAIVAAYLMLHPHVKIWVLALGRIPLRLSAMWILGAWVLFQIAMFLSDGDNNVSWAAHIGGIMAGVVLVIPLKRRSVPLFDAAIPETKETVEISAPETEAEAEAKNPWGRDGKK